MRITGIETMKVPPSWVWVKVYTDEGITGLGEPFLENHGDVVIAEVERLKSFLIGEDPTAIEFLWQKMYYSGTGYLGGPIKMSAISGIDMALWDIKGKALGLPVYRLLGGPVNKKVMMYHATGGAPSHFVEPGDPYRKGAPARNSVNRTPEEIEQAYYDGARQLVEWGFKCLKIHVGMPKNNTEQYRIDQIAAWVHAARAGCGKEIELAIDVHNPHPTMAIKLARLIEDANLLFMEEPVPTERIDYLRQVVNGTSIPVAVGERWMGKWAFREALDAGAAVLQPDLAHSGGITELKKIAGMAECYHATMAIHCPLSPLSIAASLQLDAAIPNCLVQEHNEVNDTLVNGKVVFGNGYFKEPFVLEEDGCIHLSEKPGLGVEIDEEGLARIMEKPWTVQRG